MSTLLIVAGAAMGFYAVMASAILATAFTQEARERARRWQSSREAANWRAVPRYRRRWKLFARLREA